MIFETDIETMVENVKGWNKHYDLGVSWSGHSGDRAAWVIGADVVTAEYVVPDLVRVGVIRKSTRRDLEEWEPWNGSLLDYYRRKTCDDSNLPSDGDNETYKGWERLFEYLKRNFSILDNMEQRKRLPDETDLHVEKLLASKGITFETDERLKFQKERERKAAMSLEELAREFVEGGSDLVSRTQDGWEQNDVPADKKVSKPWPRTIRKIASLMRRREEIIANSRQAPTYVRTCQDEEIDPATVERYHSRLAARWYETNYCPDADNWESKAFRARDEWESLEDSDLSDL